MGTSKKYLRLFTFAGVLILVSSLMLGLFNEARAVDMKFTDTPGDGDVSGQETFTVNIEIPDDERVPIDAIQAVVEQQDSDSNDKTGADVVARAECPMTGRADTNCPDDETFTQSADAVPKIKIIGFFAGQVGDGYSVGYDAAHGHETGASFETTGYGYDTQSSAAQSGNGYGYGYDLGTTTGYSAPNGYGYGYDGDTLIIQIEVTVDGSALQNGDTHYLTVIGDTGSDTIGDISSPFTEFTVSSSGGGPPSGGGGGGGGNNAIPVQTGLDRAFDVSQNERVKIISGFPDGFQSMLVTFNRDCNDCSISLTSHGANPPSGTDAMPTSFRAIEYFSIEVKNADGEVLEGYIDEGSLDFDIDRSDLDAGEDPDQVVLNHRTNPWASEETRLTSSANADPLQFNGTLSGFSEFATAVDTEGPTISNTGPTGDVATSTLTLAADFADNRGVDADSFELLVDGNPQTDATASEDGFTYGVSGLADGPHTVSATVSDTSGLTTTEEWTFTIVEEQPERCDETGMPSITSIEANRTDPVPLDATITVSYDEEADCPVTAATLTVDGTEVDVTPTGGTFTADLSELTLSEGDEFTVDATVTDEGGRSDSSSETFQAAGGPGDVDGDDGGALVWIIVGLIVLAVIGVGAYFYMEEQ